MSQRTLKRLLGFALMLMLVLYFGVAASILILRCVVLPHFEVWRPRLEQMASRALQAPVLIGSLQGGWQGWQAKLSVNQLKILDPQGQPVLAVPHASAIFSWRSLLLLRPMLSNLTIDEPFIKVSRTPEGALSVAGIVSAGNDPQPNPFINWALTQEAIVLRNGTIAWHDAKQAIPAITLSKLGFALLNYHHQHRFGLQAEVEGGPLAGPLDLRARFHHSQLSRVDNIADWNGMAYLSTGPIDLAALDRLSKNLCIPPTAKHAAAHSKLVQQAAGATEALPLQGLCRGLLKLPMVVHRGHIEARTWFKFSQGQIYGLDGSLRAENLALRTASHLAPLELPKFALLYHAQQSGQELSLQLRHISMQLDSSVGTAKVLPNEQTFSAQRLYARYRISYLKRRQRINERFSLKGDLLDLGLVAKLARALPLPSTTLAMLERLQPEGILRNYSFEGELAIPNRSTAQRIFRGASQSTPQPSSRTDRAQMIPFSHYRLKADFENISLARSPNPESLALNQAGNKLLPQPIEGLPGFSHLSGSLDANERHGQLKLTAQAASITLPAWLDEPKLSFDKLAGEVHWRLRKIGSSTSLNAQINSLAFANADAAGTLQASYHQIGSRLGELNLQTQFSRAALQRIPRYLPNTLSPALRTYLSHALLGGTAHNATLQINGPLEDFPFSPQNLCKAPAARNVRTGSTLVRQADMTPLLGLCRDSTRKSLGTFRIYAPFTGGRFDPAPTPAMGKNSASSEAQIKWPGFEDIKGVFQIDRHALKFDINQARYREAWLSRIHGQMDSLTKSANLIIDGQASGPLNDMLHYLQQTPIPKWIALPADQLQAKENATLALHLSVPCDGSTHIGVSGTLKFLRNSLSFSTLPPLSQLTGQLKFTERSLALEQISAQWLGGKVKLDGAVNPDGALKFEANGHLSTDALSSHLAQQQHQANPLTRLIRRFNGNAPYQISLQASKNSPPTIIAKADLDDVALNLPAPLAKPTRQPMSLRFTLRPVSPAASANLTPATFSTDHKAQTAALSANNHAGWGETQTPTCGHDNQGAFRQRHKRRGFCVTPTYAPADHLQPTSVTLPLLSPPSLSQLEFEFGPLRAIYLQYGGLQPKVVNGAISFNRPATLPKHGVVASAYFKQFDLDAWQAFAKELFASGTNKDKHSKQQSDREISRLANVSAAYMPSSFALRFKRLTFANRVWPHLDLQAWHMPQRWHIRLTAPNIAGNVLWRLASTQSPATRSGAIEAHLTRLAIPTPLHTDGKSNLSAENTDDVASLNLKIDNLSIHNHELGALEVALRNVKAGADKTAKAEQKTRAATPDLPHWQLDKLQLTHPAAQLTAHGSWQMPSNLPLADDLSATPRASFDFKLALQNAGAMLNLIGLPSTLRNGSGTLTGNLNWQDKLIPIDYTTLTGSLALDLQQGQIVQVEPGMGKLAGILSLQSLARFLTLDFRDLTDTGLSFERITGSAAIDRGMARTDDFKINSNLAQIEVTGQADLAQQQQNLQVDVKPALSAGSAVLAATFINPFWGIGSYLAQQMLSLSVSHSLAARYHVSGSWSKPQIERIQPQQNKIKEESPSTRFQLSNRQK